MRSKIEVFPASRELGQHAGLEHAVRLIDGADFLGRRVGREHAALRNRLEPPLGDEPVQNLADAFAGDAENLRQTMFRQFRAGRQPPLEQRAGNRGMDAVVERRAAELARSLRSAGLFRLRRLSSLPRFDLRPRKTCAHFRLKMCTILTAAQTSRRQFRQSGLNCKHLIRTVHNWRGACLSPGRAATGP